MIQLILSNSEPAKPHTATIGPPMVGGGAPEHFSQGSHPGVSDADPESTVSKSNGALGIIVRPRLLDREHPLSVGTSKQQTGGARTATSGALALLSPSDADDLSRLSQRLQSSLSDVIRLLPIETRSPAKAASELGVDKSTCYRIWRAAQLGPSRWGEVIPLLPGTPGLRRFANALKRRKLAVGQIDVLQSAIDQLDVCIRDKFGSHTRLKDLLTKMPGSGLALPSSTSGASVPIHQSAFESVSMLNRSSLDLDGAIVIVRPARDERHIAEVSMLVAYLGYRASPGGRPLVIHVGSYKENGDSDAVAPEPNGLEIRNPEGSPVVGRSDRCIVQQFSTHPLPSIIREHSACRQFARLCIDPAESRQLQNGLDLVAAFHLDPIPRTPEKLQAPFKGFVKSIDHPSKRMIVDVYLHKSFARASVPSVSCHAPAPSWMAESQYASWAYRLPEYPELRILPLDTSAADDSAWPRGAAMTEHLFEQCAVNRGEYVGHRMSASFPIWPALYKLGFDYD